MSFKVAKNSLGQVTACGPNDQHFEPAIPPGGTLEISATFQPVFVSQAIQDKIARRAVIKADAEADNFIDKLRDSTPTQIQTFVAANVTDLASAKIFLAKLGIAVAYALQGGRDK